ncbi:MAG: DUF3592 domain-containing protein, partial [Gammaproteobacteria bacterium]
YWVDGRRHTATRYRFGWPSFGNEGDVKKIVAEYPAGEQVRVYYDPDNPGVSTLRPGLAWFGFIVTVVFLSGAVIVAWVLALAGTASALERIGRRGSRKPHYAFSALPDDPDDWEGPGRLGRDTAEPR